MKIFLLAFFFSIFFLNSQGQTSVYHPFPKNFGSWTYQYYDDYGKPTGYYTYYFLNGDTTLSGVNYKRIHRNSFSGYVGGVRDSNKIIYFYPASESREYVLYDFNLNQGDSIIHPFGGAVCSNDTLLVHDVDSILCPDGYRNFLSIDPFIEWIEGVGSLNYLLEPTQVYCVSGNDRLECMVSDSNMVYHANFNSLGLCITSIESEPNLGEKIFISPNPSSDKITISNYPFSGKEAKVDIYNMMGEKLQTINFKPESAVDVSNLAAGVYLVEVRGGEKTYRSKIIKQ